MIAGINESEKLRKHVSRKCKCKFDDRKCNLSQKQINNKCRCECKNLKKHHACKNDYIWNPATCTCENGKYLASVINDLVIMCDATINTTTVSTNFNEKR